MAAIYSLIPWLLSLILVTLIYFAPLNLFLAVSWRASLRLTLWSFGILCLTWIFYWVVPKDSAFGSSGWFVTCVVGLSVVLHFSAARWFGALENRLPAERAYGWVLFSGVLAIAAVITVPLLAALTKTL